jgi:hypothetical protein
MDALRDLVGQHSGISIGIVVGAILIAGLILKKIKALALILIVLASFIVFLLMYGGNQ